MKPRPFWAALLLGSVLTLQSPAQNAPTYTLDGIVNAATNRAGKLAPNSIVTVYGKDLAKITVGAGTRELLSGALPYTYEESCVTVLVDGVFAPLLYVSPNQVNFLIPAILRPGLRTFSLICATRAGPKLTLELVDASPSAFQSGPVDLIATHVNGELCTPLKPALAGEIIILYATGLGQTIPQINTGQFAQQAAQMEQLASLQVLINHVALPAQSILYAGVTPGFAGLYQINFRLPETIESPLEVQLRAGSEISPPGLYIPSSK